MKLSSRATRIKPSPTLAITVKAQELRAGGRDIIGFGAGEPDFDTPSNIKQAAVRAIDEGFTKYTPVGGIEDLKDAIIAKLKSDNGLEYRRSQVFVSCGAKHSLFNIAQVLFESGDEVIVPAPYWVSYPDIIVLADATPVIVQTSEANGFKLDPADLKKAVTPRTKAVIINSPSNPTGTAYTASELGRIAEIIAEKEIIAISDDIYEKIIYDGMRFADIASCSSKLRGLSIIVNGVSKSHAMTGWRIGYAAGPENVIKAATDFQSQNTSNPTSIAQKAAVEALKGSQDAVGMMVGEFQKRRDFIVDGLNDIPGVSCLKPQGAFYVFPNVSGLFGRSCKGRAIKGSADVTEFLLENANVAVIPGVVFGNDNHIRLSYATSMRNIEEGLKRIKAAVSLLS